MNPHYPISPLRHGISFRGAGILPTHKKSSHYKEANAACQHRSLAFFMLALVVFLSGSGCGCGGVKEGEAVKPAKQGAQKITLETERLLKDSMINQIKYFIPDASETTHAIWFEMDAITPRTQIITPNTRRIREYFYFFFDKNYNYLNHVKLADLLPSDYDLQYPVLDTTYLELPVFDIGGKTREEIRQAIPDIIWDGPEKWEPNAPFVIVPKYTLPGLSKTREAVSFNLNINGENGPMAAKSRIYILDSVGVKTDSIDLNGEETFMTCLTDDGDYLAVLSGRAYPEEGGGDVKENFRIYDLSEDILIHSEMNIEIYNGTIWQKDDFFFRSIDCNKNKVSDFYCLNFVYNPRKRIIRSGERIIQDFNTKHRYTEEGVYDWQNPEKLKYTWDEFTVTPFNSQN